MTEPARIGRRTADEPIAIVGMAGLFPMARNYRDYWQNILDAVDCTTDVPETHWRPEDYFDPAPSTDPSHPDTTYCTRGGFVPATEFAPGEFGMPPNQLEVTTTVQLLSLVVARDLLRDAGAVTDSGNAAWYDPARTGVTLGVTGPMPLTHPMAARLETPVLKEVVRSCGLSDADAEAIAQKYLLAFPPWEENTFPGLLGNVTAGRIANRFDLGGMNCAVDAACASSLSALRLAASELAEGRADLMITGGCDTENTVFGYMCFSRTQALSKGGRIKPFDDAADGTLVGEGIGLMALKRLADAERDGDRVYAVVKGIGSSSDGRFGSIYAPRASGQERALRRAYADADLSPASVELFEGHATGTAVGDRTELTALGAVLGDALGESGGADRAYAAIGSVKSQIGHTKGAAGTASLMKLALSLRHKVLPPTINISTPNRALADSPLYPNTETRPWIRDPRRPVRRAAASAMGFGGTNFHVVLEEAEAERPPTAHRGPRAHLWHAPDRSSLVTALDGPEATGEIPAGDARIGFVSRTDDEAASLRALAATLLGSMTEDSWTHPRGVFFRAAALPDVRVAALFAGQGSQYVDMGRQAAIDLPPVGAAFDAANAGFGDAGADTLAAAVFPPPTFASDVDGAREAALRRTDYAQPAIGALAAGQYAVLRSFGLAPEGFLGHSFGELTALWAAGSLSEMDFHTLARARGRSMAPPSGADYDPGTMAAVSAAREVVEEVLGEGVVVCNHNAPDQVVIGGSAAAVAAAVAEFAARGITAKELPVAAAFHTSHVDHAVEAFRAAVGAVEIGAPAGLLVPNSPGAAYGDDVAANREVLAEQLRRPVEFVSGLERLAESGATVFVEFGPKKVLTGLVQRTLGERAIAIATDAGPSGDSAVSVLAAAVQLVVLGAPLTGLNRYAAEPFAEVVPKGMTVTLTGMTHRPDSRREAYAKALSDGYKVALPAGAVAATAGGGGAAAPLGAVGAGAPGVSGGAGISAAAAPIPPVSGVSAPVGGEPAQVAAPAARALPSAPPVTPAVPASPSAALAVPAATALAERAEPVEGPAMPGTAPSGDAVAEHLGLHTRYLDSQLRIAEGLVDVLRTGAADPRVQAGVRAVADSALAISRGHTHANEVLARMTGLAGATLGVSGTSVPGFLPIPGPAGEGAAALPAAPVALAEAPAAATSLAAPPAPAPVGADDPAADLFPGSAGVAPASPNGAAPAVPAPRTAGIDAGTVRSALLAVVSEKTGYPVDMVEPGMDLEADLGIDSIKRVQILGAVAERVPGLPQMGPEQLAELRSVDDIVGALAAAAPAAPAPAAAPAGPDPAAVRAALLAVVSEKTGYPVDMVEPGMDLEADLGIDSIKRVQILGAVAERVPGLPQVGPEQLAELRSVDDIVGALASTAAQAAPAAAPAGPDAGAVRAALLAVVSEKTGYPVEMVEPGMDLEADLGIDSIKRVQILGAVAERVPGLPQVGPEQLAELRSVDDIVGALATAPAAPAAAATAAPAGPDPAAVRAALLSVVSEKTGYPVEMVEPGMDLEADLGIDSIKRVQILGAVAELVPGLPPVGPEQLAELRSVDDIVGALAGPADTPSPAATPSTATPNTDTPSTTGTPTAAAGIESATATETRPHRFAIELAPLPPVDRLTDVFAAEPVAWLVEQGIGAPAALTDGLRARGWTVTTDRPERLDAVILLAGPHTPAEQLLTDAVLTAGATVDALRRTADGSRAAFLTVTRIDGGLGHRGTADLGLALQGGLTGLAKTLAREAPGVFARALDVAPGLDDTALADVVLTELHDPDLVAEVGVDTDRARWTPVRTDLGLAGTEPGEPTVTADDVVLVTGGGRGVTALCVVALAERVPAEFLLLGRTTGVDEPEPAWAEGVADEGLKAALITDLRNGTGSFGPREVERQVSALIARREIRSTLDAVRAAGARVRYLSADVADAEAVRTALGEDGGRVTLLVHGAGALADAALPDKTAEAVGRVLGPKIGGLRAVLHALGHTPRTLFFGSVAGVLGNPGQADYAAANEALDRAAAVLGGTALHWGAWDGGMVTPDLKELFAARGVALLAPRTGATAFVEQLGRTERAVLVAPGGALAPAAPEPVRELTVRRDTHPLTRDAVVADHRIGAHPVLPLSGAIGWMARTAERAHRDLRVVGLRDVGVHRGIVLDGTEPAELTLTLERGTLEGDRLAVRARITSGAGTPHFGATLLLAATPAAAPAAEPWEPTEGDDGLQVYRDADLFHGPLLQGLRRVVLREETALVAECELADTPLAGGGWAAELHSPVLGDVVLQVGSVLGVWYQRAGCLPLAVGGVELFAPIPAGTPFRVSVADLRPTTGGVTVTATVTDPTGRVLQRWTDIGAVSTPDMAAKFAEAVRVWNEDAR